MESNNELSVTVQTFSSGEKPPKEASVSQAKTSAPSKKKNRKSSKTRSSSPAKPKSSKPVSIKSSKKLSSSKSKSSRRGITPIGLVGAVDILSPVAMENLGYIAHNAEGALVYRGYPWAGGPAKKKGKGSKGKKKK